MSAFGNKIKLIRQLHNQTQSDMAEALAVTAQYVSCWERGDRKRRPSDAVLKRISDVYSLEIEELTQLRDEEMTYPDDCPTPRRDQEHPEHIQNVLDILYATEELESVKMAEDFCRQSNNRLLGLLKPYSLSEIKKEVLEIRSIWSELSLSNIPTTSATVKLKGALQLDKSIFFSIEHNDIMMKLVLQSAHFSEAKAFENWIDHHHCSFVTEELIPHITKKQKVVHFFWFSPRTSPQKKFEILHELQVDFRTLDVYDNQLNWLIQLQQQTDKPDENNQVS